jgi:MFS transporter, FHS family, glucose/mannose:H+ symporter
MYSRQLVFAAACLGMLLFGIVFLSLGSVNNMLSERFGLSNKAIGTLAALLPAGILVGSLIFGPIVDRFGYRWMLIGAALMVGMALEGLAFATSERLVQLSIFLVGFGGGVLNGATNALVADIGEGQRGANLSLLGVFFGIGALTMPFFLALLSQRFALSSIVAGIGVIVLVPVVFCLVIDFPAPKQSGGSPADTSRLRFLLDPFFLLAALAMGIQSGMEGMSNDWLTRYYKFVVLSGEEGVERNAQIALIALTSGMVLTRLALASLLRWLSAQLVLLTGIAIAAAGALALTYSASYWGSLAGPILIGTGLAAAFPVTLGLVADRFPNQSGTAFSIIFVVALLGNMLINKTFGNFAEKYGIQQYTSALLALLVGSAILLSLVVWLSRRPADQTPSLHSVTPVD